MSFLEGTWGGFCWFVARTMEPNRHQNKDKKRGQLRNAIFAKSCCGCSGGSKNDDREVGVGNKKMIKNLFKNEIKTGRLFGIRFCSIFLGLGIQVGM